MADGPISFGELETLSRAFGGRTEVIRTVRDLDPATAGIADELSRQYFHLSPLVGSA